MTRSHSRSLASLALALPLVVLLPGCLIGSSSTTESSGRYISEKTMREVEPGAAKDFVLAVYGEPTARIQKGDDSELWKWTYRRTTESSGGLLILVSSSKTTVAEGTVWVRFEDDAVAEVWRDSPPSTR